MDKPMRTKISQLQIINFGCDEQLGLQLQEQSHGAMNFKRFGLSLSFKLLQMTSNDHYNADY